jgi:hypothetical protein
VDRRALWTIAAIATSLVLISPVAFAGLEHPVDSIDVKKGNPSSDPVARVAAQDDDYFSLVSVRDGANHVAVYVARLEGVSGNPASVGVTWIGHGEPRCNLQISVKKGDNWVPWGSRTRINGDADSTINAGVPEGDSASEYLISRMMKIRIHCRASGERFELNTDFLNAEFN